MPSDGLFAAILVPADAREAVSDRAWLQAMLDAERALAAAEAAVGIVPQAAAEAIAAACRADLFDAEAIGLEGRRVGNPAEPLVRALRKAVGEDAAEFVHRGATSQDIVDTAAMLVARNALDLILAELEGVAAGCAALAEAHRSTPMAGRTLLQQALPTTFGFKAAGWLAAVLHARRRLFRLRTGALAAQLGGAVGTLASLGADGLKVLEHFARELGLDEPVVPWHTNRIRVAEIGAALDIAAGTLAKIATDVVLLAQTEVGEVAERAEAGRGGSSTLPHKRNPVGSTLTRACAQGVHGASTVLSGALVQEHERAAGAWQAEWLALSDALALTAGAATWVRDVVEGLEVDTARMRHNLEATNGLIMAERVAGLIGSADAHEIVRDASQRASASGRHLREELVADSRIGLTAEELDAAFDPAGYLGSAEVFVDRALDQYRQELNP